MKKSIAEKKLCPMKASKETDKCVTDECMSWKETVLSNDHDDETIEAEGVCKIFN